MTKSYAYEVQVNGEEGRWYPNEVQFETRREAELAAAAKRWAWTMCRETRVVERDKPANYRWDTDRGLIPIPGRD